MGLGNLGQMAEIIAILIVIIANIVGMRCYCIKRDKKKEMSRRRENMSNEYSI